jgi:hypothetical protein
MNPNCWLLLILVIKVGEGLQIVVEALGVVDLLLVLVLVVAEVIEFVLIVE